MPVTPKSCSNITNKLVHSKRNWTSKSRKVRMLWKQTASCSKPMERKSSLKGEPLLITALGCNESHWLLWAEWCGLHFSLPSSGLHVLTLEECSTYSHFDLCQNPRPLHQENAPGIKWHLAGNREENDSSWQQVLQPRWGETHVMFWALCEYMDLFCSRPLLETFPVCKNTEFWRDSKQWFLTNTMLSIHLTEFQVFIFYRMWEPK